MLYIVIPVHNRKTFTEACLDSLSHQTVPADHIILVDDGSTDGTKEMLATRFPDITVVQGDGHLFWTAAINLGIRKALDMGADQIMTLNNDTVASPDFVEKMLLGAKEKPGALIGALNVDIHSKKPYYGGEIFEWRSGKSRYLLDVLHGRERQGLHEVSLFPGRGLLIPRTVFEKVGLFEEKRLPHYMADYDFTFLARKNGFRVYCSYDAKLFTYPDEAGDHKIRKQKTIRNFWNHLFSIRGGGNLRNFTVYAIRNCPQRDLLPALFSGYARRIGGFWIR